MRKLFKIDVPFVRQKTDFNCGPATLEMVFRYFSCEMEQELLAKEMKTNDRIGTKKNKMIEAVKENGFHYSAKNDSSLKEIEELRKCPTREIYNRL